MSFWLPSLSKYFPLQNNDINRMLKWKKKKKLRWQIPWLSHWNFEVDIKHAVFPRDKWWLWWWPSHVVLGQQVIQTAGCVPCETLLLSGIHFNNSKSNRGRRPVPLWQWRIATASKLTHVPDSTPQRVREDFSWSTKESRGRNKTDPQKWNIWKDYGSPKGDDDLQWCLKQQCVGKTKWS